MNIMTNIFQKFDTVANAEAGATLHFTLPDSTELAYIDDKKKKPLTVTMLGSSSSAHKAFGVKQLRKMRNEAKSNKDSKSEDTGISDNFFDETAEQQVERLVAVVTAWENMNGLDCTAENVRKVFAQYEEMRVQAINFLDKRSNFTKS